MTERLTLKAKSSKRVAVLGAGIMGSCLSLFLARRGIDVTLFDLERAPMSGVSRWNEGKIHLGYLYAADPSLRTVRRVLPGGLAFRRLMEELLEQPLAGQTTMDDDFYLIHNKSVVGSDEVKRYFDAISKIVREQPNSHDYLSDASCAGARALSRSELESIADTRAIVAGFRVPERSVRTVWVANRLCEALLEEPHVTLRMGVRITRTTPEGPVNGPWCVHGEVDVNETFYIVVNALWHGRIAIDLTAGLLPEGEWSNRYRVSLFTRTSHPISVPSAIVAVGPFGDIKNYNGRDFYLSWYPAGLLSESEDVSPEVPMIQDELEKNRLAERVQKGLESVIPGVLEILTNAEEVAVEGGFVFALGQGSLADPGSSLHRRDGFGVRRSGHYFSVDTGKYSTAPWLAKALANEIACA